ncbi:MAG: hypothetical protein H0T53_12295 [Herpetosiphonaceae bacterium]|nr:hypothetical protein [Herpetosiphonaceae bacterium]
MIQRALKFSCFLVLFGLLLSTFSFNRSVAAANPIVVSGKPQTPISVSLTLDKLAKVGDLATATVTVRSAGVDSPDTTASLLLPSNMELVAGTTRWQGDLAADQPVSFTASMRISGPGNAKLQATVRRDVDKTNVWADLATLYFHANLTETIQDWRYGTRPAEAVSSDTEAAPESDVAVDPPALHLPIDPNTPAAPADASTPTADAVLEQPTVSQSPDGTITINGTWNYHNRAGTVTPVKLLAELLDASNNHLAWAYTGWDGSFSFTVNNPGQFKVRAYTYYKHTSMVLRALRVIPNGTDSGNKFGIPETYYVTSPALGPYADGVRNIGSWWPATDYSGRHAWWIYTDMLDAFFHPYNCTPECTTDGAWMPDGSTAEWTPTSTVGTYYSRGGNVHLEGEDRNSASTVIHEYGHNVMWNVYGEWMPVSNCPSPHYIQYTSHINCAWTEGWANFFSMAVRNQNFYAWPSGATLNLETPHWTSASWDDGAAVEGRVAGALWDTIDTANDGFDTWNAPYGFREIWEVVYNQNDSNFAEYWSAWLAWSHSRHFGLIMAYQNTIDYDTAPTISGLPNITRTGGGPFNNVIDLWIYASDAESTDSQLTYTIQSVSNPSVGVSIDSSDYLDADPVPGWWGTSTVVVRVSDGAKSSTDTFVITILPFRTFMPNLIK